MQSHAFTFAYTFTRQDPTAVFKELKSAHFTGVNLALNYHGSRDFLLRQGPRLEYLKDGFHYYKPDLSKYPNGAATPTTEDSYGDNKVLDSVLAAAKSEGMKVNAWLVFAHNSAIGMKDPSTTVTNALGNNFLSELCPSNERVQKYFLGMVADLTSRGIDGIVAESLHFHGARHGEHHERFFMELSPTTEFLFSLCFCESCIKSFSGDGASLKNKVAAALKPFLEDSDPWLDKVVTKSSLKALLGEEILNYLKSREATVTALYKSIHEVTKAAGVKFSYVDQSTLLDMNSSSPLKLSWLVGIDNEGVSKHVDAFLPLVYRKTPSEVEAVAKHYKSSVNCAVDAILRPTYPDSSSASELIEKVAKLNSSGVSEVDFYLLDTWRPRDLQRVAAALERMA